MSAEAQLNETIIEDDNLIDPEQEIKFSPPLFRQRYDKVYHILDSAGVTSVADFGCAECNSLKEFRNLSAVERLIGIDFNRTILENKLQYLQPLISDYICRRKKPLKIQLFHGDILQFDQRLAGVEAIVMIEVIEHLMFDDLKRLPAALFGVLKPKLVVITTPNAEFNVLFPNLVGFRHADHKFEWTRSQFSDWCDQVASDYGYSVEYSGVGDPPSEQMTLGCCSQICVFRQSQIQNCADESTTELDDCLPYELLGEVIYPTVNRTAILGEDILNDAIYYMNFLRRQSSEDDNATDCKAIQLDYLQSFSQIARSIDNYQPKLREILKDAGYQISEDGLAVICPSDDESNHSSLCTDSDCDQTYDSAHQRNADTPEIADEDWDQ